MKVSHQVESIDKRFPPALSSPHRHKEVLSGEGVSVPFGSAGGDDTASGRIAAWIEVQRLTLSLEGGGISQMFKLCSALTDIRLTHFSVSSIIFQGCVVGKMDYFN